MSEEDYKGGRWDNSLPPSGGQEYEDWRRGRRDRKKARAGTFNPCFVATACFDDEAHPTVERLRHYRDFTLANCQTGRLLIEVYGEVGLPMALFVKHYPRLKAPLRAVLTLLRRVLAVGQNACHKR